jgi:hypothetical protein
MSVTTMWRHVARRAPWRQLVLGGALCMPIIAARSATARSPFDVLPFARLAALVLAAAAVLAVDDPASSVTAPTPIGRLRLRVHACAATVVVMCCIWTVLMATARVTAATPQRLPTGGLALELLVMCAAGWSIAAGMREVAGDRFVTARAAAVLVLCVAATVTTPRLVHWFWVGPGSEWHRAHVRWVIVGLAAMTLFSSVSVDPARRRWTRKKPRQAAATFSEHRS